MLITTLWKVDLLIILTVLVILLYKYFTRNFEHWKKRGVYYLKPVPFFGNFYDTFTFKKNIAEGLKDLYDQTDKPYFGVFAFDTPVLIIKSPELIKTVLIRDFTYFNDRSFASPVHNPLFSNFLLFQGYGKWKDTRSKIRPIFASTKLKLMFSTVLDVVKQFEKHIQGDLGIHFCKPLCERFSSEIVSRCFFGVNGKCLESGESTFLKTTRNTFHPTLKQALIQLMYQFKPEWVDVFKLDLIGKHEQDYLVNVFTECMESRKTSREKAKDYIDLVLKERETNEKYTNKDLMAAMANSVESFIAGNDTISNLLSFTLYHLAIDSRIQNKLRQECQNAIKKYGSITLESLQEMPYAEMCVNETSRRYVTLQFLDRKTVQDYKLPDGFVIEKGTVIYIPSYALHMDEKYFPEPEKYIPERFMKDDINENGIYFMPFGAGPRMCIAAQFGKMVLKSVLAHLITTFEIQSCDGTPKEIIFDPRALTMQSIAEIPIKMEPICRLKN